MDALDNFMKAPGTGVAGGLGDLEGLLGEALLDVTGGEVATGAPSAPPPAAVGGLYDAAQCLTAVSPRGVLSLDANTAAHGTTITGGLAITHSGATAPRKAMTDVTDFAESQGAAPTTGSGGDRRAPAGLGMGKEKEKERNRQAQARLRKRKRQLHEHQKVVNELQESKIKALQESNAALSAEVDIGKRRVKLLEELLAKMPAGAAPDAKRAAAPRGQSAPRSQSGVEAAAEVLAEAGGVAPEASLGQKMTSTLKILCTSLFLVSEFVPASDDKNHSMQFLGNLRHSMKQALQDTMPTARGPAAGAGPGSGASAPPAAGAGAAPCAGLPTPPGYWAAMPPGMAAHAMPPMPHGAWPDGAKPPPGAVPGGHVPMQAYPAGTAPGWGAAQLARVAPPTEPTWFGDLRPST